MKRTIRKLKVGLEVARMAWKHGLPREARWRVTTDTVGNPVLLGHVGCKEEGCWRHVYVVDATGYWDPIRTRFVCRGRIDWRTGDRK